MRISAKYLWRNGGLYDGSMCSSGIGIESIFAFAGNRRACERRSTLEYDICRWRGFSGEEYNRWSLNVRVSYWRKIDWK